MRVLLVVLFLAGLGVECDGAFPPGIGSSSGQVRAPLEAGGDTSEDKSWPLPEGVYSLGTRLPRKKGDALQPSTEVEGFLKPVGGSLEFSSKGLQLLAPPADKPKGKGTKQISKPAPVTWSRVDRKLSARWKANEGLVVFEGEVVGVGRATGTVIVTGKTGQSTQGTFRLILRVKESDRKGDADWRKQGPVRKHPGQFLIPLDYHEPPPWLLADESVPFDIAKFFQRPPDSLNGAIDILKALEALADDLYIPAHNLTGAESGFRFKRYWDAWHGGKLFPPTPDFTRVWGSGGWGNPTPDFMREIASLSDKLYPRLRQGLRRSESVLPVGLLFARDTNYLRSFPMANRVLCLKLKAVLEYGGTTGRHGKRRISEAIEILHVALRLSQLLHRRGENQAVGHGLNHSAEAVNFCVPRILAQGALTVADCDSLINVLANHSRDCVEALPEMLRTAYVDFRILLHELIRRTGDFDPSRLSPFRYPANIPPRFSAARQWADTSFRYDRIESVDSMTFEDEARVVRIVNREIGRLLAMDRAPLHKWTNELLVTFRRLRREAQFTEFLTTEWICTSRLLHETDLRGWTALTCVRRFHLKEQENPESLKQAVESAGRFTGLKWPINDPLNPGQPLGFIRHPDPNVDYESTLGTLWKRPGNLPSVYSIGRNRRDDTRGSIDLSDEFDDRLYLVQVPEVSACQYMDRSLMSKYGIQLSKAGPGDAQGRHNWKMKIGKTNYIAGKPHPGLAAAIGMFGSYGIAIRERNQVRLMQVPRRLASKRISSIDLEGACDDDVLAQTLNTFPQLQEISLDRTAITDAGLEAISGFPLLDRISLKGTKITDSGLMHLASTKTTYTSIELGQTPITDEGLATLSRFSSLKSLGLDQTKITDAGLEHLSKLKHLQDLSLVRCSLSDNGARHLKPLTNLQSLDLGLVPITDEGLVHLKGLTNLQDLTLSLTKVTDAGLVHLKGLTNLQDLTLSLTKVTDAGLVHLKGMTKLQELALASTTITGKGFVHLKDLPTLQTLSLEGCEKLGDQLGVQLGQFSKLESLKLNHANIRDQQLTGLGSLGQLTSLDLRVNPELTDAGLAHLKGLSRLKTLSVFFCPKITGPGLQHLATLEQLQTLNLGNNPGLTDAGLQHLARIKSLKKINLSFCQKITIEGVKHLKGLQQLEVLNLQFCNKIPREEIPSLKQALPKCRILHGGVLKR